jgi:hypothetical protein
MRFEKWQALGNDYVILEREQLAFDLTPARVRAICRDHTGVSADGVLLISPPHDEASVAELRIFNPDGSEAELSGNGAREAALYMRSHGWTDRNSFEVLTPAGAIRASVEGPLRCRVDLGTARLQSLDFPSGARDGRGKLHAGGRTWRFRHVSIGNPQCAIELGSIDELAALDLARLGPPIEGLLVCRAAPRAAGAHPGAHLRARRGRDDGFGHRCERRRRGLCSWSARARRRGAGAGGGDGGARRRRAGGRDRRGADRGADGAGCARLRGSPQ